ncbi:MAG: pyridoxamine 5'-phosphate oxidase family protein [Candidatus Dormibacteraeota bacterium]|nr:pyridoxamine 5'-phosphate oxidase family protein [Candidatus Dormibacteraeota bacterium]
MTTHRPPTRRTTVRRHAERGRYDRQTIDAILDEGLICHLGFTVEGQAQVIPTMYARRGDTVYVHGAVANRALSALRAGAEACLVVTILDGLVMARSAFNHSMNYRSVVVVGPASEITDRAEKLKAMEALLEQVAPGRWTDARQPSAAEMASTVILALPLDEASAKVRSGPPVDDPADMHAGYWAGVIPLQLQSSPPVDAPELPPGIEQPAYARKYRRPGGISQT